MSELYEGVVFRSEEQAARNAFASLSSGLRLRLVRLAAEVFGIYRIAGRAEAFDQAAVERVAKQVSAEVGQAAALFYDNRGDLSEGVLYCGGQRRRVFGDRDTWWVPYSEGGQLLTDGPRFRISELRPDMEYDCIFSEIDAALEAIQVGSLVTAALLKQAFCYEQLRSLAESGNADVPGATANRPSD